MWFLYVIDRENGYKYLDMTSYSWDEIYKRMREFSPLELIKYSLSVEKENYPHRDFWWGEL